MRKNVPAHLDRVQTLRKTCDLCRKRNKLSARVSEPLQSISGLNESKHIIERVFYMTTLAMKEIYARNFLTKVT